MSTKNTEPKKENTDIYVTIKADRDFYWPNILRLEKDKPIKINQSKLDFIIENVGNFNDAVDRKEIIIGEGK